MHPRSLLPAPARLFSPGCALAAGLLILAPSVQAAPVAVATPASMPAMKLRVGKTATYPLPPRTTFAIEAGALNIFSEMKGNTLTIKALEPGEVRLRLNTPGKAPRLIALQLVDAAATGAATAAVQVTAQPDASAPLQTATKVDAASANATEIAALTPAAPAAVTPAAVTPAAVTPVAVTPAAVTPAAVTPAAVTPAAVSPAAVSPTVAAPNAVSPNAAALIATAPATDSPTAATATRIASTAGASVNALAAAAANIVGPTEIARSESAGLAPLEAAKSAESANALADKFGSQTFSPADAALVGAMSAGADAPAVRTLASPQVVDRATAPGALPQPAPLAPEAALGTTAPAAGATAPTSPFELFPPGVSAPATGAAASPTSEFPANIVPPQNLPPQVLPPSQSAPTVQLTPQTTPKTTQNPPRQTLNNSAVGAGAGAQLGTPLPAAPPRAASSRATPPRAASSRATPPQNAPVANSTLSSSTDSRPGGASISPSLPTPATGMQPRVNYKTTPKLPPGYNQISARNSVEVTQGLARLLTFQNNILSVFFSDPAAMDARAINARTIAVTGTGPGQSTLAVFTARYPGDAVGYPSVYRITTLARGDSGAPSVERDAATVEEAISAALGDPRIRVSVVKLPDNSLAARLTGVVRNEAEVQGALTTASFFAPRVLPSVYADANAPSIDAVLSGVVNQTPQDMLEDNLRRITGNQNIELISMPGSLILKAEVASQDEAQNLMQLLPTLNQPVVPFITIRGGGAVESSNIPLLQGEDLQLTQKLQAVTGVRTVYAVRASTNSVAIYGNVRSRGEYEAVKRYGLVIAQASTPVALAGTTQGGSVFRPQGGEPPPLPAYDPAAGYARQLGVQMFVRILDPADAVIRNVTIETNIVEITRNNLKNLGAEYGSVTLTGETVTAGTRTPQLNADGNPIFDTNGNQLFNSTPSTTVRTIDPTFSAGTALLGNGFTGSGGFAAINPFRARINAIAQNNNARVLASPNIRATEGTVAQITIGGERPVPVASASFGSNAQSIEFRRFGVILTMRPTVSDDNTIILQIRADVTQPDPTYSINVGGAIIPGESVRSIDTTLTVRPGDIVVMGGLLSNDKRQQTSKVPILGDIPILGALFTSKRFEQNETELAIFMSPRIDALPATQNTMEIGNRIPSFPALPGRQESNGAFFQTAPRAAG